MRVMTARTWTDGDPEPDDHPPVVDGDGVTWLWTDPRDDDSGQWDWCRQYVSGEGVRSFGPLGCEWDEVVAGYGPVRAATAEEARSMTVRVT